MSAWWRARYCFWMLRFNWGSDIPMRVFWDWSDDNDGVYDDQTPMEAAMDTTYYLRQS